MKIASVKNARVAVNIKINLTFLIINGLKILITLEILYKNK